MGKKNTKPLGEPNAWTTKTRESSKQFKKLFKSERNKSLHHPSGVHCQSVPDFYQRKVSKGIFRKEPSFLHGKVMQPILHQYLAHSIIATFGRPIIPHTQGSV